MPDARALAAAYGVRVELADLGDWGSVNLIAEYDPDGPVIRIDTKALRQAQGDGGVCGVRAAIDEAIAHELYHHREAIGEIPRLRDRAARERAADAYAAQFLASPVASQGLATHPVASQGLATHPVAAQGRATHPVTLSLSKGGA